jgi:hypothetical protein
MTTINERWEDFNFDESKEEAPFLSLPNTVMEDICRLLDNTRDKYEACLISRKWSTAAQNVLWERPRFKLPLNFRNFMTTIRDSNKAALLVRDVYLCFLDHQDTCFKSIVKSNIEKHNSSNNALANPNFMGVIARNCEKLTSLTLYGWRLENIHIESLASMAQNLTSLTIIGANQHQQKPLVLNSLLPRLITLRLDSDFGINERWAESLITKATSLTTLQLSLQNMDAMVFAKICTPNKLRLIDLTLTDATNMMDSHVKSVFSSFPSLKRFCLIRS